MFARPFYEIPVDRYFFSPKVGQKDKPEEKVRQWVISELLSFYGFTITNIQIEVPVKIGTRKDLRADIVIYKDSFPYIVIECKKQGISEKELQSGLKQAISYAESSTLQAPFAICTNGESHLVKQKFNTGWEVIPDIDKLVRRGATLELSSFLLFIANLKPLFYWLHKPIPAHHAQDFFNKLNKLIFDLPSPKHLGFGFGYLLNVLEYDLTLTTEHGLSKMKKAFIFFIAYLKNIEVQDIVDSPEGYFNYELINILLADFSRVALNSKNMSNLEARWIRLIFTLLQYLGSTVNSKQILDVPIEVMQGFQGVLEVVCEETLNVRLPDILEKEELKQIQYFSNYLNDNPHPPF